MVLVGTATGNWLAGRPIDVATFLGLSNAAEAAVASWWLLRGQRGVPSLTTLPDLGRWIVAAVLGGVTFALAGTATIVVLADGPAWPTALHVFASHTSAVLLVTALVLRQDPTPSGATTAEAIVQALTVAGVTVTVFATDLGLSVAFLLVLPLLWGAMRLSLRAVTVETVLSLMLALTLTAFGVGPLSPVFDAVGAGLRTAPSTLLEVVWTQLFAVSTLVVVLALAITTVQRRALLLRVRRSEQVIRGGFDDALLGLAILRRGHDEWAIVEINPIAEDLLRVGLDRHLDWDRALGEGADVALAGLAAVADGRMPTLREEIQLAGEAGDRWAEIAAAPVSGEAGMVVLQLAETTSRRRAELELEHQAIHDSLTGLPNRALLRDRLDRALAASERTGDPVAVVMLDVDGFTRLNDTAGQATGDAVLRQVASRLAGAVRQGDTVARLGGDEFAVVLPGADADQVAAAIARIQEAFGPPVQLTTGAFRITVSVGIAGGGHGSVSDELLQDADTAMFMAKTEGSGLARWFDDSYHQRMVRAATVASEFEGALDRGEIVLFAQPLVDLGTGTTTSCEGLVRWQHPARGLLAPSEWLDIVIGGHHGSDLEAWILHEACRTLARWSNHLGSTCPELQVNVSTALLRRGDLDRQVLEAVAATGAPADRLVIELTETDLESVGSALPPALERLRQRGIRIAVDDFGTGFSTFSRLAHLPVDEIKIDKSFTAEVLTNARSAAVVHAMIELGHALGLRVVAEGVESSAQADHLREAGCDLGQGYLWSEPRPMHEVVPT
jgi:diguanylate cyclase (GGDEF)-like protein